MLLTSLKNFYCFCRGKRCCHFPLGTFYQIFSRRANVAISFFVSPESNLTS